METMEEVKESGLWEDDDLSLTDATTVKGEPWNKLKAVAMKPGFTQSFQFVSLTLISDIMSYRSC